MKAKKKDLASHLIDDILSADSAADETIKLGDSKIMPLTQTPSRQKSESAFNFDHSVRASVGRFAGGSGAGAQSPAEASLIQSENLKIAQQKILDLETEIERLRRENESLAAAGETMRKRGDEHKADAEKHSRQLENLKETYGHEREIINSSLSAKDRENKELKLKVTEYDSRLQSNLQKIRVRERELENRLELVRMESGAVVRNKDETLLDLKRRLDQMQMELENYRQKNQEVNKDLADKGELLRRTAKALRLALSMIESDADGNDPSKR
jgi:chromosome segregation ATPase